MHTPTYKISILLLLLINKNNIIDTILRALPRLGIYYAMCAIRSFVTFCINNQCVHKYIIDSLFICLDMYSYYVCVYVCIIIYYLFLNGVDYQELKKNLLPYQLESRIFHSEYAHKMDIFIIIVQINNITNYNRTDVYV